MEGTGHRPTILAIEDEAAIRRLLKSCFDQEDYRLIEAETAKEGIELITKKNPDVVILDLGLPDANGKHVVDTVRGSMAEIGEKRRYEPDPEYSYSAEEFARRVRGGPKPAAAPRKQATHSSFGRPAAKRGADKDPMLGRRVRHPILIR